MAKLYNYKPDDTLSIMDVSDIMQILFVSLIEGIQGQPVKGSDDLQVDDVIYDLLPDHLKRHFIESEEPKSG